MDVNGFSLPIKVVQFLNFQQQVLKTTCTCKKLAKLKLTTNLKLTFTQFIEQLEESWLKENDSCSKKWKNIIKMKSKVLKQVCPPGLILVISKYNSHNWPL